MKLDVTKLNKLEQRIHQTLSDSAKAEENIKIKRAAEICGCSVSKVSKFSKKFGFTTFKEYMGYLYGKEPQKKECSAELMRIRDFIDGFEPRIVDDFIGLLDRYDKIILFGYGPSLICAQYFEYKLRIVTSKSVMTAADEATARTLLDDKSLFIAFSATGKFKSFSEILAFANDRGSKALLIVEEYNTSLLDDCDSIIFLTNTTQVEDFLPYEKSRSVLFIFIEEVLLRLLEKNRDKAEPGSNGV